MSQGPKKKFMHRYWQKFMESKNKAMSRGAENVDKIISWARGDNWRRSDRKNKKTSKK